MKIFKMFREFFLKRSRSYKIMQKVISVSCQTLIPNLNEYLVFPCIVIMSNSIFISRSERMSSIFVDSLRLIDLLC